MGQEAYVTFGANDSSALGCMVLGHSLRKHGTLRTLVALVTEELSPTIRKLLATVFDLVHCVPNINLNNQLPAGERNYLEANVTLLKVNCWCLTQFTKCVFLDADTLVLENCDELFERAELSAAADTGWPDCFNSGVFVFTPSLQTYYALIDVLRCQGSFDESDQGLLNSYFGKEWQRDLSRRLPFVYNLVSSSSYTYIPAYLQFGNNAKIVHFVGYPKPWSVSWNIHTGKIQASAGVAHQEQYLQEWLNIFISDVLPFLPEKTEEGKVIAQDFQGSGLRKPFRALISHSIQVDQGHSSVDSTRCTTALPTKPSVTLPVTQQATTPWLSFQVGRNSARKQTATDNQIAYQHHKQLDFAEHEIVTEHRAQFIEVGKEHTLNASELSTVPSTQDKLVLESPQETNAELSLGSSGNTNDFQFLIPDEVEQRRLHNWELGHIDYEGEDSFDNIWHHLQQFIEDIPSSEQEVGINNPSDSLNDAQDKTATNDSSINTSNPQEEPETRLPGYHVGDYTGMHRWEQGNIDYDGRDSSDRIMRRLDYLIHGLNCFE